MAYALNYPNAPTTEAAEQASAPKGFFQRLLASIERVQMRRFERELMLYAPHLYESIVSSEEYRNMRLSQDERLPFVK
jgi:hypothetical protein